MVSSKGTENQALTISGDGVYRTAMKGERQGTGSKHLKKTAYAAWKGS